MSNEQKAKPDLRHVLFEGKPSSSCRVRGVGAGGPGRPTSLRPAAQERLEDEFLAWVLGRAGFDADAYRPKPLRRRLPACLRVLKARSKEEAREVLEKRPELLPGVVSSLLIGVTEFFRNPAVLEELRSKILPELASRGDRLRVWSAACSTGAEVYSMAILLAEAGLLDRSSLLGTDCRADAIEEARAGCYGETSLRLMASALRRRYFENCGGRYRPVEALRRRVHWKVADLLVETEEGPWDIILWRNVAIYLNPGPARGVWRRLASVLAPGGVLVVGRAERPPEGSGLSCIGRCIYRVSGDRLPREKVG